MVVVHSPTGNDRQQSDWSSARPISISNQSESQAFTVSNDEVHSSNHGRLKYDQIATRKLSLVLIIACVFLNSVETRSHKLLSDRLFAVLMGVLGVLLGGVVLAVVVTLWLTTTSSTSTLTTTTSSTTSSTTTTSTSTVTTTETSTSTSATSTTATSTSTSATTTSKSSPLRSLQGV